MRRVLLTLVALIATARAGWASGEAAPNDQAYDARVRSSFRAAESFQGPLDGGWALSAASGAALFDLRFVDAGDGLQAVWRDLRRPGALDASGTVDEVTRRGRSLTLRFHRRPDAEDVLELRSTAGGWTGELTEHGRRLPVRLARSSP
ncbi:MAG TPA: hypothetical protein VLI41_00690 [Phenylobacterium sp.]|uniref:hypothetical protein n=1 Tax=Phenylobacterium sp. TaxID=1871053 RepID=UPI002BEFB55D|nr:hypothetical protein [Phenylobacterium sp.]HSV01695.1 hypothetical protein [Phenylobacterium sp.]